MKLTLIALAAALGLAACVNVHVHFPAAKDQPKSAPDDRQLPNPATDKSSR